MAKARRQQQKQQRQQLQRRSQQQGQRDAARANGSTGEPGATAPLAQQSRSRDGEAGGFRRCSCACTCGGLQGQAPAATGEADERALTPDAPTRGPGAGRLGRGCGPLEGGGRLHGGSPSGTTTPMIWECVDDIGDFWETIYDKRSELSADAGVEDDDADSGVEAWLNPALWTAPAPTEKANWRKIPAFPLAGDGADRLGQESGAPEQPPQPDNDSRNGEVPAERPRPTPRAKTAWGGRPLDGYGAHRPGQQSGPLSETPGRRRRGPAAWEQHREEVAGEWRPWDGDGADWPALESGPRAQRPRRRRGKSAAQRQRSEEGACERAYGRRTQDGDGANRPVRDSSVGPPPQAAEQQQPTATTTTTQGTWDGDGADRPGRDDSSEQQARQASQQKPGDGDGAHRPVPQAPLGRNRPGSWERRRREEDAAAPRPPAGEPSERLRRAAEGLQRAVTERPRNGDGAHSPRRAGSGLGWTPTPSAEWDALYAEATASGDPENLKVTFDALRRAVDAAYGSVPTARARSDN